MFHMNETNTFNIFRNKTNVTNLKIQYETIILCTYYLSLSTYLNIINLDFSRLSINCILSV